MKPLKLLRVFCISAVIFCSIILEAQTPVQPNYKRAAYAGEQVRLENDFLRIDMFKRFGGWGWGEPGIQGAIGGSQEDTGKYLL